MNKIGEPFNGLQITEICFGENTTAVKRLPTEFYVVINGCLLLNGMLIQYPSRISHKLPDSLRPDKWGSSTLGFHKWLRGILVEEWKKTNHVDVEPPSCTLPDGSFDVDKYIEMRESGQW